MKISVPTPFAVGPVNLYFFPGDEPTLVDTGPMGDESFEGLRTALRGAGYEISDLKKIYVTHGHLDHFGQGAKLRDLSGAEVYAHPEESVRIQENPSERLNEHRDIAVPIFRDFAVPEDVIDGMFNFRKMFRQFAQVLEETLPLADGEVHRFGNVDLEVVHCPGHASGLVCFYQREQHYLVANDHLIKHITPNPVMQLPTEPGGERFKALWTYLESLDKVRRLRPKLVYSGHGVDITDTDGLIDYYFQHHDQRQALILGHLNDGVDTVYELCRSLFPSLESSALFLGLSEIIGHLECLELRGKVHAMPVNGYSRYLPSAD